MFFATGLVSGGLVPGTLTGSCGDNPGIACRLAWDVTHSTSAAQLVRVYLAGPVSDGLRILFVIVVALVVRAVANRVINKVTERAATATLPVAAAAIRPAIRRHRAPASPVAGPLGPVGRGGGGSRHGAARAARAGARLDPAQRGVDRGVRDRGADHPR